MGPSRHHTNLSCRFLESGRIPLQRSQVLHLVNPLLVLTGISSGSWRGNSGCRNRRQRTFNHGPTSIWFDRGLVIGIKPSWNLERPYVLHKNLSVTAVQSNFPVREKTHLRLILYQRKPLSKKSRYGRVLNLTVRATQSSRNESQMVCSEVCGGLNSMKERFQI